MSAFEEQSHLDAADAGFEFDRLRGPGAPAAAKRARLAKDHCARGDDDRARARFSKHTRGDRFGGKSRRAGLEATKRSWALALGAARDGIGRGTALTDKLIAFAKPRAARRP